MMDYDYLTQLDDFSRMGAFRFKHDDDFIGASENEMRVPPLTWHSTSALATMTTISGTTDSF